MMDSFVKAQNNFEAQSNRGTSLCLKGDKPHSSLLVHTCDREVTGLKTYQGPKRKEQFGVCSLPDTMYQNESSAQSRAPVLIAAGPAVNFVSDSVG
jgi:hypothetical protein